MKHLERTQISINSKVVRINVICPCDGQLHKLHNCEMSVHKIKNISTIYCALCVGEGTDGKRVEIFPM